MGGRSTKKLVIPSDLSEAARVVSAVLADVEAHGYDDTSRFAIRLALDEALANAIKHGNCNDPARQVVVEFSVDAETTRISITDEGCGFDPGAVPDPTLDENLERPHGRGVMLMKAYMNHVEFNTRGNCVTMIKERRISAPKTQR